MENEPELIRDQMQDTRTALTEKLGALEQHVTNTVKEATGTVTETVQAVTESVQNVTESVKETVGSLTDTVQTASSAVSDTVESTVETVKQTFDIPSHVERHPWMAMFGSVAVGFAVGKLLGPSGGDQERHSSRRHEGFGSLMADLDSEKRRSNGLHSVVAEEPKKEAKRDEGSGGSIFSSLLDAYSKEADKLKGLGLSAVFGVVRDLVSQNVPGEMGGRLQEWFNGLTQKMGAEPLKEPILSSASSEGGERQSEDTNGSAAGHGRKDSEGSSSAKKGPQEQQQQQRQAGPPSRR